MKIIGITGSLSSGKSTVAKFIVEKKNYPLFSADKEVSKLYRNKLFITKLQRSFNIKKKKNIKKIIKLKIKIKKNLIKLEKLIHPLVRMKMNVFIEKNRNKNIIVLEIPLLIESKLGNYFDLIIFVGAPKNLRIRRFLQKGGNIEFFKILDTRQIGQKKKSKFCDHQIVNNKSKRLLKIKVSNILRKYE